MQVKKINFQQIISKINNLYFFINKINFNRNFNQDFNKKGKIFNFVLISFLILFVACQSLAISHLSSHNYQNNHQKTQHSSVSKISPLNEAIVKINNDDLINCHLCFLANLQKKINNSALIFIAIILVNLIFKTDLNLFKYRSESFSIRCRAPPLFV